MNNSHKRICFVNPTLVLRRPLVELARIYAEKGYRVSVLFPAKSTKVDEKFHFNKNLKHKNIKLFPVKSTYSERFRFAFPSLFDLLLKTVQVLKENDIIHVWDYYHPYIILPLMLRKIVNPRCRIILTIDGLIGYNYHPPEKWLEIGFKIYTHTFGRILFNLPNRLTTYSKYIHKDFPIFLRNKFEIVPTGIHLNKIKFSAKARQRIRKKFGVSTITKVVLFVGMLTERKRVDIVIKAAKDVADKDVVFLIIGDGYLRTKLEQMKLNLKLKNVRFLGKRKDVVDFYSACDVFFLPSLGEGLPGTVMEAMACGKPVVATRENGTIDLVNKDVGFIVEPDGDFTSALNKSLEKKFDSQKIKKQIKKFDWKMVFENYEK